VSPFVSAAIAYAHRGIAVFPLKVEQKQPATRNGLKDAKSDPAQILEWWRRVPRFNVGIATGSISGFWVLDLDGPEAEAALAALEARYGALPATVEQSTGKGRHLCFAVDPARPIRNSASKIGAKIDVRGDGGYIVAPPSIHPSGRSYAWREGRSPGEIAFASAPTWLVDLAAPVHPEPETQSRPIYKPPKREGRATPYGEAALTRACRDIASAPPGRQDDTLYDTSCGIGCLVAGGEIEGRYAAAALMDAGLAMTPNGRPWLKSEVADKVERAFLWGVDHPKSAPERNKPQPAAQAGHAAAESSAGDVALAVREARALWAASRSAWVKPAREWFEARGLDPGAPALSDALARFRAHANAPYGGGVRGPALIAPMTLAAESEPDAIAILPLHPRAERFEHFIGDPAQRVIWLTPRDGPGALLVAIDLQDAWVLASHAGERTRVAVAPLFRTFVGGALGDRYGRVDPDAPQADPQRPPWTRRRQNGAGEGVVYLAMRRDLRTPALTVRNALGGSRTLRLEGQAAARFSGALAQQHWTAAGANAVRLLFPSGDRAGFNPQESR
jgi:hypothetical protein